MYQFGESEAVFDVFGGIVRQLPGRQSDYQGRPGHVAHLVHSLCAESEFPLYPGGVYHCVQSAAHRIAAADSAEKLQAGALAANPHFRGLRLFYRSDHGYAGRLPAQQLSGPVCVPALRLRGPGRGRLSGGAAQCGHAPRGILRPRRLHHLEAGVRRVENRL